MGLFYFLKTYYSLGNILYSDLSKAKIPQKIMDKKIKPTVKPELLPKDKEIRFNIIIKKTMLAIGIKNMKSHHVGLFAILSKIMIL